MTDARFEDGAEPALFLTAQDGEDLAVISALTQDSVFPASEMKWQRKPRRFALLLNRFRWEDQADAKRQGRRYERVQSLLMIDDVLKVTSLRIKAREQGVILLLLSMQFEPGPDGTGRLVLTLAGDCAIGLEVEALNVTLRDVTRPYGAPSGRLPDHLE